MHTYVPSRALCARAHSPSAKRRRRGHSQFLQVGPLDRRRQRRELGVVRVPACHRAAAPGGSGPPRSRAGRTRAPDMRARGSAAADDRQRRIQRRAVRPGARRGSARVAAQRRHRRERARRRLGGAGRTVPPRACTFRATRGAPSPLCRRWTCRAPRARAAAPAAHQWADVGTNRAEATESHDALHAHTHPHARDRHTDTFGAVIVPKTDVTHAGATNARPHARLDAAPKYMHLNMDGCPYTHSIYVYIDERMAR